MPNKQQRPEDAKNVVTVPLCRQKREIMEAVIVEGLPEFLLRAGTTPELNHIGDTLLVPPGIDWYLYKPYAFKDHYEVNSFLTRARTETMGSLFQQTLSLVKKYVDDSEEHLTLIAADIILTYFQDQIPAVHYLQFVGGNNVGKSSRLALFPALAYRCVDTSQMTPANIYEILGTRVEASCTLCIDEADDIDRNDDLMRLLKVGYTPGKRVLRIDTSQGRVQRGYYTYCFKVFAGERLPNIRRAKGFLQRTITVKCYPGEPQYDINEVMNSPQEEYEHLQEEIRNLRNLLLAYRILHFGESFPAIKTSLRGREKQLFEPLLRMFYNTESFDIIQSLVASLIHAKREDASNSFHTFLYKMLQSYIASTHSHEVIASDFWKFIKLNMEGEEIFGKPQTYYSEQFGHLSMPFIKKILIEEFGASETRIQNRRILVFSSRKLQKLAVNYDVLIDVEVLEKNKPQALPSPQTVPALPVFKSEESEVSILGSRYLLNPAIKSSNNSTNYILGCEDPEVNITSQEPPSSGKLAKPACRQGVSCTKCGWLAASFDSCIEHSIRAHPGYPIVQELTALGHHEEQADIQSASSGSK